MTEINSKMKLSRESNTFFFCTTDILQALVDFTSSYSPCQTNLQFSLCDTQILCEIKYGNLRRSKTAIFAILKVLNFDFWRKFHI